jgi:asparagine synthase (glutamine-hydrolysing)
VCGFLAVLQPSPVIHLDTARRALDLIAHRGPDAAGEWFERDVFLGHRRLAIIDLATGDQPMHSADGRYILVFNGEIYNFIELRERLVREGSTFRTTSDTEVLLEAYIRWGPGVVDRLQGMFAFVIWDRFEQSVFGARDRLGIKPLCWSMQRGALIVSSTLEPFRSLGDSKTLDLTAVRDLMTFDYVPSPRTILDGVHKLEPGSRFEWRLGDSSPNIDRYWSPPPPDPALSVPDEHELEELLDRAVHRQMVSDVPVGAFLSGGIDSSLLVAFMARHHPKSVRTFSVAFAEGQVDESPIAQLVANHFGTDHTVLHAEDVDAASLLELLGCLDEPLCDPALVPTHTLSVLTRRHVKVALSGDGGDEVFGGYSKYLLGETERQPPPFSSAVRRLLNAVSWRPRGVEGIYWRTLSSQERVRFAWSRYGDFPVFPRDLRQLFGPSYRHELAMERYFESWERRARRYGARFDTDVLMRADLETYLSENCLVKTDRASMLASLEVRVPYLDETVLDRVLPLPSDKKIHRGQLKALLLPLARRLLPREVWDRPKHGFTVPLDVRLARAWRPAVEAALDWGESNVDLFDYPYLRRLHRISIARGGIGRELWNPFVLIAWAMARSCQLRCPQPPERSVAYA